MRVASDHTGRETRPIPGRARRIIDSVEGRLYVEQLRLTGHTGGVWSVAVSANGKLVLTSSDVAEKFTVKPFHGCLYR